LAHGYISYKIISREASQRLALPACGRAWTLLGSRENSKREKCLKMPQSPTRQVHAVLGNLAPARTTTENQNHANLTRFYNELCFSPMTKNADLQTPWRFKDQIQTNPNTNFAKPDFDQN
jgi:hypothetical protein